MIKEKKKEFRKYTWILESYAIQDKHFNDENWTSLSSDWRNPVNKKLESR